MGASKDKALGSVTPIGRADQFRPDTRVMSGGIALVFSAFYGINLFSGLELSAVLLTLTLFFAWLSVGLSVFRLAAIITPQRRTPELLSNEELPTYTVLIPLFREAHMVEGLVSVMSQSDYPAEKLDVIFICEATDPETVSAAQSIEQHPFRTLVVPPPVPNGEPQTKPRALNYALERSSGTLVTIYDAEDRPRSDQLRQAASALAARPDWAAVQAPLKYYNISDTPLSAQFGLEYDGLFQVLLPFYDRLSLPFPLGGTSNHMRRSALAEAGGWDPYNVTEDADLAFRLAGRGQGIGWIDAPTLEEAVTTFAPWKRQRSRWLKGYMMTWCVHMSAPFIGGWRRAIMLQLSLGLSLLSVLFFGPVLFTLTAVLLAHSLGIVETGTPAIYALTLGFSLLCNMAVGAVGAIRAGRLQLLWHVPFMPLYWLLLFPPLIQAAIEMRTRPFHWHKTEHGVTRASV